MARSKSIANLCRARALRHQEETRNDLRVKLGAIERAAEPLSDGDAQRPFMVPLDLDPFDVWYHVFDNITDPKDVFKAWEVCPCFREILKPKYVQMRLPQIVQIVLDKRPKFLLGNNPPALNGHIIRVSPSKSLLLNLRFVSRKCKTSVEELLLQTAGMNAEKVYLFIRNSQQVQDIIDQIMGNEIMAETFFPPNVIVSGPYMNRNNPAVIHQRAELFESIGIFLELVGKRMKTFSYRVDDTPQGVYAKLSEWVLFMPNLENLKLSAWIPYSRRTRLPTFDAIPPFPDCPKLRSFNNDFTILPKQYRQRILQANPLIQILSLPHYGPINEFPEPSEMNFALQHLECIHVRPYASLLSHLEFQLPLKEIVLQESLYDRSRRVSSSELFVFLHQFRDTLEHLELNVRLQETGEYFLDLPNLRSFKLRYNISVKDLHFLLYAERLEEIQMKVFERVENSKDFFDRFVQKVTKGFDGLSLWQVFSQLKKFQIKFRLWGELQEMCRQ